MRGSLMFYAVTISQQYKSLYTFIKHRVKEYQTPELRIHQSIVMNSNPLVN